MQRKCWICGAGEFTARLFSPAQEDLVIAADGGLAYLKELQITPDFILGDFDSLGYQPVGDAVRSYPPEKDDTDMLLAVKYGLSQGCDTFYIYGGLGGRLSHTVANLQVLRFLCEQNCHGILVDEKTVLTVIDKESICFSAGAKGYLSVFSQGETASGVTIRHMKYNVENACLTGNYPLGTSNEFVGDTAEISVRDGVLLLVWEDEESDFRKISFQAEI